MLLMSIFHNRFFHLYNFSRLLHVTFFYPIPLSAWLAAVRITPDRKNIKYLDYNFMGSAGPSKMRSRYTISLELLLNVSWAMDKNATNNQIMYALGRHLQIMCTL